MIFRLSQIKRSLYGLVRTVVNRFGQRLDQYEKVRSSRFSRRLRFDLQKTLRANFPPEGEFSIILVGANDGVTYDDVYQIIKTRKTRGIAVEPLPRYFNKLRENYVAYPDIKLANMAISKDDQQFVIHSVMDDYLQDYPHYAVGISSFSKDHLIGSGIHTDHIRTDTVEGISFNKLVRDFGDNHTHFNYCQIDVEGYDAEILKMINFDKVSFDIIKYESCHLSPEDIEGANRLLESNGYFVIRFKRDVVALRKKSMLKLQYSLPK